LPAVAERGRVPGNHFRRRGGSDTPTWIGTRHAGLADGFGRHCLPGPQAHRRRHAGPRLRYLLRSFVYIDRISVIIALLIAFLAGRVWENLDRANAFATQEAASIHDVVARVGSLPAETRDATIAGMAAHLRFVETQDWPDMLAGKATLQQVSPGLDAALTALLTLDPATFGEHETQARAIAAIGVWWTPGVVAYC
jgi:hypothetical protein